MSIPLPPLNSTADTSNYLQLAKQQVLDRIIEVTASANPDYDIDGQKVNSAQYLKILTEQLNAITLAIAAEDPYEIETFFDP